MVSGEGIQYIAAILGELEQYTPGIPSELDGSRAVDSLKTLFITVVVSGRFKFVLLIVHVANI